MILEKHFTFETTGLQCTNQSDVESYIQDKVNHFSSYNNWSSKAERLALIKEINTMFDEDEDEHIIDIDLSGVSSILFYDKINKANVIMFYDYLYILGTISWAVFDRPGIRLVNAENGIHGAVNTADLFNRAYNEMVYSKINGASQYVAAPVLILATLVESQSKLKFKEYYLQKKLDEVDLLIQAGTVNPSQDDTILIDCLRHRRRDYNSVYVETDGVIELLSRFGVCIDSEAKKLLNNTITLNQLVQYAEFRNEVEPEFIIALERIFGTSNLNLRNDAAHGGYGYRNYFYAGVAGTLYYLLTMISENMHIR